MNTFWYLASPYTKYPYGVEAAFQEVAKNAALLVLAKVPVFCPITHTHPLAMYVGDADNHDTWLRADLPMMHSAHGMIRLEMEGWEDSYGMEFEENYFLNAKKPVVSMTPGLVPLHQLAFALSQPDPQPSLGPLEGQRRMSEPTQHPSRTLRVSWGDPR